MISFFYDGSFSNRQFKQIANYYPFPLTNEDIPARIQNILQTVGLSSTLDDNYRARGSNSEHPSILLIDRWGSTINSVYRERNQFTVGGSIGDSPQHYRISRGLLCVNVKHMRETTRAWFCALVRGNSRAQTLRT